MVRVSWIRSGGSQSVTPLKTCVATELGSQRGDLLGDPAALVGLVRRGEPVVARREVIAGNAELDEPRLEAVVRADALVDEGLQKREARLV
jgi:hypothetical protein